MGVVDLLTSSVNLVGEDRDFFITVFTGIGDLLTTDVVSIVGEVDLLTSDVGERSVGVVNLLTSETGETGSVGTYLLDSETVERGRVVLVTL